MDKNFSRKKIAVLGFGIEGQDLCLFLLKQKADVTVFDQKSVSQLNPFYQKFKKQGVKFELGQESLKKLPNFECEFIFRSPGFSFLRPEVVKAQKKGIVVSSATKLFFEFCPGKIIGVTGTKGKGTTATLIYQILKKDGKDVYLGGNIGQPVLGLLNKLKKSSWVVLELSSFQLQDLKQSPHIATVLFIVPEHLDYHQDFQEYIQSKANIVRYQKKNDFTVLNADNVISSSFAALSRGKIYYFSRQKEVRGAYIKNQKIYLFSKEIGSTKKLKLLGSHNWDNVCAASLTAYLAGVHLESIKKVIFNFKGLEHRLEFVRRIRGVDFYNDSFSTTPETTIAAIRAFKRPIILIAGGSEKGSDYNILGEEIKKSSVKTLILIGKTAARIHESVLKAGFQGEIIFRPSKKMSEIVKIGFQKAKSGDIVLLSPACASFDLFENYKDRGNQFKKYAKAL